MHHGSEKKTFLFGFQEIGSFLKRLHQFCKCKLIKKTQKHMVERKDRFSIERNMSTKRYHHNTELQSLRGLTRGDLS